MYSKIRKGAAVYFGLSVCCAAVGGIDNGSAGGVVRFGLSAGWRGFFRDIAAGDVIVEVITAGAHGAFQAVSS